MLLCFVFSESALAQTSNNNLGAQDLTSIEHPSDIAKLNTEDLPSISAVLNKYNERNPDLILTNWLQLSPAGMRIRDVQSKSEIIKNFNLEQVWLINTKAKTIHKVDIDFYREFFPDQVQYLIGPESISNIAGTTPCADLVGKNKGKRVWRGQVVDEWDCRYEDGPLVSTQLFSSRWNLVVQVKHTDKSIEELVDIHEEALPEHTFLADASLRHVEINEFMTGRRLLDSYSP